MRSMAFGFLVVSSLNVPFVAFEPLADFVNENLSPWWVISTSLMASAESALPSRSRLTRRQVPWIRSRSVLVASSWPTAAVMQRQVTRKTGRYRVMRELQVKEQGRIARHELAW